MLTKTKCNLKSSFPSTPCISTAHNRWAGHTSSPRRGLRDSLPLLSQWPLGGLYAQNWGMGSWGL